MEKSESIKELATALNKVQSKLQAAKKGSENPYFKSKYADLLAVWDACREPLTENGLSVVQVADTDEQGRGYLETLLIHTSGEWVKGRLPLMSLKADPQSQGSAITYARRYSLSAIVGLCTEEDDDGEKAMARPAASGEVRHQAEHWCYEHNTAFFKKGKMKSYAHPIQDSDQWCYEHKTEPKIDMDWLKESLQELNWVDVGKYLRETYDVSGTSVSQMVARLTHAQLEEFVSEVQGRLDEGSVLQTPTQTPAH